MENNKIDKDIQNNTKNDFNDKKYSNNFDLNTIKDINHPDRKYNSVMDEYRRYFAVQKKCRVYYLESDDLWEFILWFFEERYGVNILPEDKPNKKFMGNIEGNNHKKISYLHWNVKNYELSMEERGNALDRVSMKIHKSLFGKNKLYYKHMVKSPTVIWGMRGENAKFQMRYWHRKNAKNVFRNLRLLDKYKKERGNINGGMEFLKQKNIEYNLKKLAESKAYQAKKNAKRGN